MAGEASDQRASEVRPKRRLLPSSPLSQRGPPTQLPPPSSAPPTKRRPLVVTACESCRKAKAKCSGDRPVCSRCQKHRLQCIFAANPDETPSRALKRNFSSLQDRAATQAKLLDLLAVLPEEDAQQVLRMIRSGASAEVICNQVEAGDALMQLSVRPGSHFRYKLLYQAEMPQVFVGDNPYLETLIHEGASLYASGSLPSRAPAAATEDVAAASVNGSHENAYVMPFHAAHVVEPRLTDVKPSLWTEVCQNDILMRDLLGVWLRCEYSFTSAFQKDYFLEDMASQRKDFCSSLLVNAVLAYCCVCYPSFSDRAQYWNPKTLVYRFLAEAKRLWELEATAPSLTTLQAGVILFVFHNLSGIDEIGQAYRINSIALAHEMELFSGPIQGETERLRNGKLFTAWSLYKWEALTAFAFQKPPLLTEPPVEPLPDPALQSRWYGEVWVRYSSDQHLSPSHFSYLYKAKSGLRIIMQKFCTKAYANGIKVPQEDAYDLYMQLKQWEKALPGPLKATNIVLPAQLQLHVYMQHLALAIFEPLVDTKLDADLIHSPSPHQIVTEATRNLQTLIRVYYVRHGFEAMDLFIVVPLIYIGLKCLETIKQDIPKADLDLMRSTLMLVVNGLYYQRQNHYLAEVLYRVMRGRMRPQELMLARETMDLQEENEDTLSLQQSVRSHWPVSVVKRKEDLDSHMLANLVGGLNVKS